MKPRKNIIFVGNPVPETAVTPEAAHNVNIADNIAQNTIIKGLYSYYQDSLTVVSVARGRKTSKINLGYGVQAIAVPSDNRHPVLYYFSIMWSYTKQINQLLKNSANNDETLIITCGPYIYMAIPALIARLKYHVKWIPFLVGSVEIPEVKIPYNLASKLSRWTAKKADGAITYVANSAQDYIPGKPFVEIVYLIQDNLMKIYKKPTSRKQRKFTITYTGALTNIYNVDTIIDAVVNTGNKYHWVFAGRGPNAERIAQLAADNNYDVDYVGAVSNVQAVELQKNSDLLLCLRGGDRSKVSRYYSRYAASGKLIEYLCSGTPILAGDIPGFSDTIKKFMTCEKHQTAENIGRDIEAIVAHYDDSLRLANAGQLHAFTYFTAEYQSKKIYEFLEKL